MTRDIGQCKFSPKLYLYSWRLQLNLTTSCTTARSLPCPHTTPGAHSPWDTWGDCVIIIGTTLHSTPSPLVLTGIHLDSHLPHSPHPLLLPPPSLWPSGPAHAQHCTVYCLTPCSSIRMSPPQLSPEDTISLEIRKLMESWDKIPLPEYSKGWSAPQLHRAVKALKGLNGELFSVLESVLKLVQPVVSMG